MTREMNMDDILDLTSVEGAGEDITVREYIERYPNRAIDGPDEFYSRLRARIKQVGINLVPVHVGNRESMTAYFGWRYEVDEDDDRMFLGNGHHRVDICYRLGLEKMLVTDDVMESGWKPDHDIFDDDFDYNDDEYDVR